MIVSSGDILDLFYHKSKIIFIRDRAISYSPKWCLLPSYEERNYKERPIEIWEITPSTSKMCPQRTDIGKDPGDEQSPFKKKGQMLSKRYEPHCPSRTCTGGLKNKLYRIRGNPKWLTREVWAIEKGGENLCRCAHCGLVWFQESSKRLGLDARPVGYYDDSEHPWEFVSLKHRFRIRKQNTSRYWYHMGRKAICAPRRGRVDGHSGKG
jgi:hypothetical protein